MHYTCFGWSCVRCPVCITYIKYYICAVVNAMLCDEDQLNKVNLTEKKERNEDDTHVDRKLFCWLPIFIVAVFPLFFFSATIFFHLFCCCFCNIFLYMNQSDSLERHWRIKRWHGNKKENQLQKIQLLILIIIMWGNVYFKYVNYLPDNLNSNDIYTHVWFQVVAVVVEWDC